MSHNKVSNYNNKFNL